MATADLIQHLRDRFAYDPETGEVRNRRTGTNASRPTTSNGYGQAYVPMVNGPMLAHRIGFAIVHGYLPEFIDHINGDKTDNRIANLRPATKRTNGQNAKRQSNNTSGRVGVSWNKRRRQWHAYIYVGKQIHLGWFASYEEACTAREDAERHFGFSPIHGRGRVTFRQAEMRRDPLCATLPALEYHIGAEDRAC